MTMSTDRIVVCDGDGCDYEARVRESEGIQTALEALGWSVRCDAAPARPSGMDRGWVRLCPTCARKAGTGDTDTRAVSEAKEPTAAPVLVESGANATGAPQKFICGHCRASLGALDADDAARFGYVIGKRYSLCPICVQSHEILAKILCHHGRVHLEAEGEASLQADVLGGYGVRLDEQDRYARDLSYATCRRLDKLEAQTMPTPQAFSEVLDRYTAKVAAAAVVFDDLLGADSTEVKPGDDSPDVPPIGAWARPAWR